MTDSFGSSIPPGASYFRFPTVANVLEVSDFTGAEVALSHEVTAYRNQESSSGKTRSFLLNLRTHLNASMNPRGFQVRKMLTGVKSINSSVPTEASIFAERIQIGYHFDGSVVQRGPGPDAFAPRTQPVEVSDTTVDETRMSIGFPGVGGSFGVTHQVTVSVTDWVVGLSPASSQVMWDYWVKSPWDAKTGEPGQEVRSYPNLSLVGFSFDTSAWFEVEGPQPRVVDFQPVLQASLASFQLLEAGITEVPVLKRITRGDVSLPGGPFFQPAIHVDLSKVPNLRPA
jgi:hypothetical protein